MGMSKTGSRVFLFLKHDFLANDISAVAPEELQSTNIPQ